MKLSLAKLQKVVGQSVGRNASRKCCKSTRNVWVPKSRTCRSNKALTNPAKKKRRQANYLACVVGGKPVRKTRSDKGKKRSKK